MSDVTGIEVSDILGLSDPLTKLIETVSGGIGKLYEPTHIKRIAKAKAEEVKLLGGAISELDSIPAKYDAGRIVIDGTDYSELAKRAQGRLALQELKKQNNIDRVVGYAAQNLGDFAEVSSEPVDLDWTTRFFDAVSDVSTDEMQILWGKILAGEVNTPGSFSLRTLEAVRNMSKKEAELFSFMASFIINAEAEMFVISDASLLKKYKISYTSIMLLDECGLINSSGTLSYNSTVSKTKALPIYNRRRIVFVSCKTEEERKISFGVHTLTRVGKELIKIIDVEPNNDYLLDLAKYIESHYTGIVSISIHEINEIKDGGINYKLEPIETINTSS